MPDIYSYFLTNPITQIGPKDGAGQRLNIFLPILFSEYHFSTSRPMSPSPSQEVGAIPSLMSVEDLAVDEGVDDGGTE